MMFNFLNSTVAKIFLAAIVAVFALLETSGFNDFLNHHYLFANHIALFSVMLYAIVLLIHSIKLNYKLMNSLKEREEKKKMLHALEHRVILLSLLFFVSIDMLRETGILLYEITHGSIFMGQANAFFTTFKAIAYVWAIYFSTHHLAKEEAQDLNC